MTRRNTGIRGARPASGRARISPARLDAPIEAAIVDAYSESEQAVGFHAMLEQHLALPFETVVLGIAVTVKKVDLAESGHIVAICHRERERPGAGRGIGPVQLRRDVLAELAVAPIHLLAVLDGGAVEVRVETVSGDLSLGVILLSLLIAAFWGAAHALTPGHGKTLMAAYLVGTRGSPRHALGLGISVSVSHTAGILALAAIVVAADVHVRVHHPDHRLAVGVDVGSRDVLIGPDERLNLGRIPPCQILQFRLGEKLGVDPHSPLRAPAGQPDDRAVLDIGMGANRLLDLARGHPVPRHLDHRTGLQGLDRLLRGEPAL